MRDYDPEVGRWLTKDPILFNGGDANLYGYVLMDPVNFTDSKGLYGESSSGASNGIAQYYGGLAEFWGAHYLFQTGYKIIKLPGPHCKIGGAAAMGLGAAGMFDGVKNTGQGAKKMLDLGPMYVK